MKRLFLIVLPLLLIVGCSSPEPINYETALTERDGVYYTKDTNQPYSGPVFSLNEKGLKKIESILEDGKMITHKGFLWYDNGQKKEEAIWRDGKENGLITLWYENGQKSAEGTMKDGKMEGFHTLWYENGQKKEEAIWRDGKENGLITAWYENGQKKEEAIWRDGKVDGWVTQWYENGQKSFVGNFKDGKRIYEGLPSGVTVTNFDGNTLDVVIYVPYSISSEYCAKNVMGSTYMLATENFPSATKINIGYGLEYTDKYGNDKKTYIGSFSPDLSELKKYKSSIRYASGELGELYDLYTGFTSKGFK